MLSVTERSRPATDAPIHREATRLDIRGDCYAQSDDLEAAFCRRRSRHARDRRLGRHLLLRAHRCARPARHHHADESRGQAAGGHDERHQRLRRARERDAVLAGGARERGGSALRGGDADGRRVHGGHPPDCLHPDDDDLAGRP
ncbi:hypothetical protein emb_1c0231 [Coriobacteriaceae bacterium EMTCatB1]|nr:hypothetical protein emb_1c0231 [Coriobacteriaceae bacterium EMTCatB1]